MWLDGPEKNPGADGISRAFAGTENFSTRCRYLSMLGDVVKGLRLGLEVMNESVRV
jgi:hypothetical protein